MQPLRITIPGEYWDTQLYSGRLYLFTRGGDIRTINWDDLIAEWPVEHRLRLAMDCAFRRSDYLYGDQWTLLFSDDEVKTVVLKKFDDLARVDLEAAKRDLEKCSVGIQENPFPFPHSDSVVYKKSLFVSSRDGVHRGTCQRGKRYPVSSRPERKWDAPTVALDANWSSLALAAGEEGLYELNLYTDEEPKKIDKRDCTDCNWAFYSIYGSSHSTEGFLAAYQRVRRHNDSEFSVRVFDTVIPANRIFHDARGYSWGNQDKLCHAANGTVQVVSYRPWEEDAGNRLQDMGFIELAAPNDDRTIELMPWKGGVISGAVALFGTVIECDNAVVVVPSDGPSKTFPGAVVNWRVFPRSIQYENQLHLVYEDRLEIYSFNQDYFVDQNQKRSGIRNFRVASGAGFVRRSRNLRRDAD